MTVTADNVAIIVKDNAFFFILCIIEDVKTTSVIDILPILEFISGIIGITMIILGYYFSTEMFGKYSDAIMFLVFAILFLTTVGAYLFFRSKNMIASLYFPNISVEK